MLKHFKANVLWASDYKETLGICKDYKIDLILMDFQLPGMNGLELSKILREKYKNLPIIFQTANKNTLKGFETKSKPYEGILEKPISKKLLFEMVDNFVSKR